MIAHATNSLLGAVAGLSVTLGSFLSGVIVARVLGVSGAGAYGYVIWIIFMLVPVLDIGLAATVGRYVPELRGRGALAQSEGLAGYLLRRLALSVLVAVLIVGGIMLALVILNPRWLVGTELWSGGSAPLLLIALLLACVSFQSSAPSTMRICAVCRIFVLSPALPHSRSSCKSPS